MKIDNTTELHRFWKQIITFILVDIAWIFFRANSFLDGLSFIEGMFNNFQLSTLFLDPIVFFSSMGLNINEVFILMFSIMILRAVDIKKAKCNVLEWIAEQNFLSSITQC